MKETVFKWIKDINFIKPSYLLIFRFLFSLLVAFLFFYNDDILLVMSLTAYQFIFLLDYIDGAIARYRKQFSKKWRRVDRTFHYITSTLFILGLGYYSYNVNGGLVYFFIGLGGSISILLTFFIDTIWLHMKISFNDLVDIHRKRGIFSSFYSFLPVDGPFTLFYFLILFSLLYRQLLIFAITLFSIMYFLILLKKLYNLIKWTQKK